MIVQFLGNPSITLPIVQAIKNLLQGHNIDVIMGPSFQDNSKTEEELQKRKLEVNKAINESLAQGGEYMIFYCNEVLTELSIDKHVAITDTPESYLIPTQSLFLSTDLSQEKIKEEILRYLFS